MLIWAFTVDIQLTFCCGTCDVSPLVRMTRQIYAVFEFKSMYSCKVILILKRLFFIIQHYFCKVARNGSFE